MDWALLLVVAVLLVSCAIPVAAVIGTVDALGRPRDIWARAGFRRSIWLWQAAGVFFPPAALVYTGAYLIRVRPRLLLAARELGASIPLDVPAEDDTAPAPPPPGGSPEVRLRVPVPAAAAAAAPVLVLLVGGALLRLAGHGHAAPPVPFLIGYALVAAVSFLINLRFGVTLTPEQLVLHGLRRRRVRWDDIVAINEDGVIGMRCVRVWTTDGGSYRLRAPAAPLLGIGRRRFENDFRTIGWWWLAHRGTG